MIRLRGLIFFLLFVAIAVVGGRWLYNQATATSPTLMVYFIEHEESGSTWKINRRIYKKKSHCNAAAIVLNRGRPTVWLEGYSDAYILNYARCDVLKSLGKSQAERQRWNDKMALRFIGG